MSIIDDLGVKFINIKGPKDNKVVKWATFENEGPQFAVTHVMNIPDVEDISDILTITELMIKGQVSSVDDPDVSNNTDVAFLTPNGVEFWDADVKYVYGTISLENFRNILVAWKEFLQTPPYHGSTII